MSEMRERTDSSERGEVRGASVEVALRRFFRDVQQSQIMTEIKRRRYFEKSPSRNARRTAAQGKESRRKERRGY